MSTLRDMCAVEWSVPQKYAFNAVPARAVYFQSHLEIQSDHLSLINRRLTGRCFVTDTSIGHVIKLRASVGDCRPTTCHPQKSNI